MSDLPARLRASATQARAIDRAALLEEAAKELERLRVVIDCYAASSAAACSEISALKSTLREQRGDTQGGFND